MISSTVLALYMSWFSVNFQCPISKAKAQVIGDLASSQSSASLVNCSASVGLLLLCSRCSSSSSSSLSSSGGDGATSRLRLWVDQACCVDAEEDMSWSDGLEGSMRHPEVM